MSTCTCSDFQAGAIGVKIALELVDCDNAPIPLADAATTQIVFRLGTATAITKTAIVEAPDTAGVIYYVTVSNDFATPGAWKAQGVVTFNNGNSYRSREVSFKVLKNL